MNEVVQKNQYHGHRREVFLIPVAGKYPRLTVCEIKLEQNLQGEVKWIRRASRQSPEANKVWE